MVKNRGRSSLREGPFSSFPKVFVKFHLVNVGMLSDALTALSIGDKCWFSRMKNISLQWGEHCEHPFIFLTLSFLLEKPFLDYGQ